MFLHSYVLRILRIKEGLSIQCGSLYWITSVRTFKIPKPCVKLNRALREFGRLPRRTPTLTSHTRPHSEPVRFHNPAPLFAPKSTFSSMFGSAPVRSPVRYRHNGSSGSLHDVRRPIGPGQVSPRGPVCGTTRVACDGDGHQEGRGRSGHFSSSTMDRRAGDVRATTTLSPLIKSSYC